MQLKRLRYFLAVADSLHFSRAAAQLGIAQPPLSQQIRKLEEELGVALFERDRQSVHLTDAGQRFVPEARAVLERLEDAYAAARETGDGESGRLEVGVIGTATYGHCMDVLAEYRRAHPRVELNVRMWTNAEQREALLARRLDVGFMRPFVGDPQVERFEIERHRLSVALPASHPLRNQSSIEATALAGESFVMFQRQRAVELHDAVIGACANAGFSPQAVAYADEVHAMIALVAAGVGVSIVPDVMARGKRPGVVYRPLRTGRHVSVPLVLAYRKDDRRSVVQHFVTFAKSQTQPDPAEQRPPTRILA